MVWQTIHAEQQMNECLQLQTNIEVIALMHSTARSFKDVGDYVADTSIRSKL